MNSSCRAIHGMKRINHMLTSDRLWQYPILLLVTTLVVYGINVSRSKHLIEPSGAILGHDYLAFYMAGDMVRTGRGADLYKLHSQQEYQRTFMKPINPQWSGLCLYVNPPHYAWLMSFLTRWSYGPSFLSWILLSLLGFAGTVFLWRSWVFREEFSLVVALAICMPAWFQALAGGQNSFFSLLIFTGFCWLLMKGRDFAAGLVLSLLAFKFQFLIVPLLVLTVKFRWRVLAGFFLGGFFTLIVTYVVLGPGVIHQYLTFASSLGNLMQQKGFDAFKQHSWHGFFQLLGAGWLSPAGIRILTGIFSFGTVLLLIPIFRKPWDIKSTDFPLQLAALMVVTLVTSPHLFHYDMLLLTLPAVLWFRTFRLDPKPAFDEPIKTLLAFEFLWLLAGGFISRYLHLQLSPILLVLFLSVLYKRARSTQDLSVQGERVTAVKSPGEAG